MKKEKPTEETALQYYMSASYQKKAAILYSALGYMEQYNGRSKHECIRMAVLHLYAE